MKRISLVSLCACWLLVIAPGRALAYLDPGSGSMLLQVLLGGLAQGSRCSASFTGIGC
ncbi:MAG: hypothetical protein ACRERD_04940 [Candidatus Binatia bacterium]